MNFHWVIDVNLNLRSTEVEQKLEALMATQAEYQAIVNQAMEEARAQNTRLTSLEAFVEELYKALRAMDIPPEQMAVAEQLLATLKDNAVKIEETFKENVPTP